VSFTPVLHDDLATLPSDQVKSGGFVLETLHASLWSLLQTRNFHDCVLTAVNLGSDTDTTGCVAGGLAGVAYGWPAIPAEWLAALPRQPEVQTLFNDFARRCVK
jgi:ADP-ribosyl-[dinitrogen reductase] hydrolase